MTSLLKYSTATRIVFTILLSAAGVLMSGLWSGPPVKAAAPPPAPLITLLTPSDGAALNAQSLRVQALVAAVKPDARGRFVFDGQPRAGRNAGTIDAVDLVIDQRLVAQVTASPCRREFLLDERVDLTALADGPHTLRVTAYEGRGRRQGGATVSTTFTLDRTLPLAPPALVEAAATPAPFACFAVRDLDDAEDDDGPPPVHPHVHGRFVLGGQSDGIDLKRDRMVLAAGTRTIVIEPGAFRCDRRGDVCRYENSRASTLERVVLERRAYGVWSFQIDGGSLWPRDPVLHLRIGNDWGGIDLATGEPLVRLQLALDASRQAQATIGSAGGTLQTTDASGVVIRLQIPPGALTRDTLITETPLLGSPMAGSSTSLHPGVEFQPDGLVFTRAATLTLDFSATGQAIIGDESVFLLTSPLSALPLFGAADPASNTVTALLHHFSPRQAGLGSSSGLDVLWVNRVLASPGPLSLIDIETLVSVIGVLQRQGRDGSVNLALLTQQAQATIDAEISSCSSDVANPSDEALARLLHLEGLGQSLGAHTSAVRNCEERVLTALINSVLAEARVSLSDASFQHLLTLHETAQRLGFANAETLALGNLATALRVLLNRAQQLCQSDPGTGRNMLSRGLSFAAAVVSVDATLEADIQQAMNSCTGVTQVRSYSGTFRDLYSNPIQEAGPSGNYVVQVTPTNGSDADLVITFIYSYGQFALLAHATVTPGSIMGQLTKYVDPSRGGAVALTINSDGSLSGTIMTNLDAYLIDGYDCQPSGLCVEVNPRHATRYFEFSR